MKIFTYAKGYLFSFILFFVSLFSVSVHGDQIINWDQEKQTRKVKEFISLQAKPGGLVEPPRFVVDSPHEGILHQEDEYFYGSFLCTTKKELRCQPYIASLKVDKSVGLAKSVVNKLILPVSKEIHPEYYFMSPLQVVDIDQDGKPELVMSYKVIYNNQPGYGTQTTLYRAIIRIPDLSLLLLTEEGSSAGGNQLPDCVPSWKRLVSLHEGKPDLQLIQTCKWHNCLNQTDERCNKAQNNVSLFCFKKGAYSAKNCEAK